MKKSHPKTLWRVRAKVSELSAQIRSLSSRHPLVSILTLIALLVAIGQLRIASLDRHDSGVQHREDAGAFSRIEKKLQYVADNSTDTNAKMAKIRTASPDYARIKEGERLLETADTLPPNMSGRIFDDALEMAPMASVHIRRARNHAYCNRFEAALEDLTEAEKIDPNRAEIHACRGLVYLLNCHYQQAEACLSKAQKLDRLNPTVYLLQCSIFLNQNKPERALEILNLPILLQDNSLRLTRCFAMMECGRYDEARQDASAALKHDPEDYEAYHYLGLIAYRQGDYPTAIDCFSRGLATNHVPAIPLFLSERAYVYMRSGNDEKAREDYLRLRRHRPYMPEPLQGLMRIAYKNARYEEMLQYIDTLDALNPSRPNCTDRFQAYYKLHGMDTTLRLCECMLLKFPNHAELTHNAATLYYSANRLREAEQMANRTLDLDSDNTDARILQARIAQEAGLSDKAIECYTNAINRAPQLNEVWYQRGMAYLEQSDYTKAFYDFENAIGLNPKHAASYFARGICRFHFGEPESGKADLAITRALDADCYMQMMRLARNWKKTGRTGLPHTSRPEFDSFYYSEPTQTTYLQTHNGYLRLQAIRVDSNRRTYDM